MTSIALTGASGRLGGRVARRLVTAGLTPRLLVREAARAPDLPGCEVAVASYGDAGAARQALAGVDAVERITGHPARSLEDLLRQPERPVRRAGTGSGGRGGAP